MHTYETETILEKDGTLILSNLPFRAGERVKIQVEASIPAAPAGGVHPLRGMVLKYDDPTKPVAEADWEAGFVPLAHAQGRPHFGSAKGLITLSEDFDEPLEDFAEYMP